MNVKTAIVRSVLQLATLHLLPKYRQKHFRLLTIMEQVELGIPYNITSTGWSQIEDATDTDNFIEEAWQLEWREKAVIAALMVIGFLNSVEGTAIGPALPVAVVPFFLSWNIIFLYSLLCTRLLIG
jgi:hypothetical protein